MTDQPQPTIDIAEIRAELGSGKYGEKWQGTAALCDEVERLRGALADIAYNTSSSVPLGAWPVDHYRWMMQRCIGIASNTLVVTTAAGTTS